LGGGDQSFSLGAVAVQPDSKVILAGETGTSFGLFRLTAAGQPDPSFGHGGQVVGPLNGMVVGFGDVAYSAESLVLQPDGKIVAAGWGAAIGGALNSSDIALARYEPDGTPDVGFGQRGSVETHVSSTLGGTTFTNSTGSAVALQPDGKIVVAGVAAPGFPVSTASTQAFVVVRFTTDGNPDTDFGSGGQVVAFVGAAADAVAILADGTIVAAGNTVGQNNSDFALAALDDSGNPNPRWGSGGTATLDFHGDDRAEGLALEPGGDGVLAGPGGGTGTSGAALARYQGFPSRLADAAGAFAHSPEHSIQFVAGAYQRFLKRAPDALGLNFWVGQLQAGAYADEQVEAYFLSSQEYLAAHGGTGQGWISALYQDLLGRTPTPAEVQSWVNVLLTGGSPFEIAYGFAASREREAQRVRANYQTYLGRDATQAEVDLWVGAFLAGLGSEDMVAGFVGSPEYYYNPHKGNGDNAAWVSQAYQDVLRRTPSADEIASWLRFLG
jgi:uncharacterized delta-60 repeat protein